MMMMIMMMMMMMTMMTVMIPNMLASTTPYNHQFNHDLSTIFQSFDGSNLGKHPETTLKQANKALPK